MEKCFRCGANVVLLLSVLVVVRGFNVDMENMVKYRGPPDSMFGFSVAEHRESGTSWVLVGAPSAQTRQPGVVRGGAVFRCESSRDNECQEVPFDRSGNNQNSSGHEIDQKSRQWFGATVQSSGDGGAIVACAPRYIFYPVAQETRFDPVGTCFVARESFRRFSEYSPCRTSEWGYHRQGSCQAGLGASISKDGTRLFIGAPGSRYWQGQLHSVDATIFMPFFPPEKIRVIAGQLFSENLHDRLNVLSTDEDSASEDDSYLGYSVAVGHFNGDGERTSVAVGRPRGGKLLGKVLLYTWDLYSLTNITGEQLGAYFGYALCVSDVDGDGLDDVIVGAPLYTHLHNNEDNYETGRIYVFYQKDQHTFQTNHTRDGKNSKSRFGLSLAGLGDINMDGYGDFVVGAPYDGPNERGAIYIYLGSRAGVMEKYSQVIYADDIHHALTTFGFSVSGGVDMDNNEYPDLVVGAYESNMAVLLRARPIVKMAASVVFGTESKLISLEDLNCTLQNGARATCTSVNACLEYTGVGAESRQDFEVQLILDSAKPKNPRMFFVTDEGRSSMNFTERLIKNSLLCRNFKVYIMPGIRDKLTALEVEMWYGLRNGTHATQSSSRRRFSRHLMPILDQVTLPMQKDSINIFKNCGSDNVCIPDLQLIVKPSVQKYLLGSGEQFEVDVLVNNHGEDAFEASYNLKVPLGLNYINIERIDSNRREIPVQCSPPSPTTNNTLKCDIGNPLPEHKHVHFKVLLQPFYTEGLRSQYQFNMEANSTNPEEISTRHDNFIHLEVPILIDADLEIQGASLPHDVHYNTTTYNKPDIAHESDIGPQVAYIYTVRNKGPADVVEAEVFFLLPTKTLAGDNLLYLLDQPQTSGPIACRKVPEANYLKLELDYKKSMEISKKEMQSGLSETSSSSGSIASGGSFHSQSGSVGSGSRRVEGGRSNENGRIGSGNGSEKGRDSSERTGSGVESYGTEERGRSGISSGRAGGGSGEKGERTGGGSYWVEEGGRAGSGGGKVQGGTSESGDGQITRVHDYGLYGQVDEGKVLTRDEGFIAGGGAFGHNKHVSSEHSHTFENHSTSSSNQDRTEGIGSGSGTGNTRVYSSHNYSTSSSENGEPTHHFSNYSSYDSDLDKENGRRRVGGSETVATHHSSGEPRGYNITRTHHSSSSSSSSSISEANTGNSRDNHGEDNVGGKYDSDGSKGVFRHYSSNWSSGSEGIHGSDNVNDSQHSEDGQYGYLGNANVRTHHYSSSSNDDNVGDYQGSDRGHNNAKHYTSSNWNRDNVGVQDRRQYTTSQGHNTNNNQYTSSNWGSGNVGEHQDSNRGQYGSSQTHTIRHYTSSNWDDDSNSDTHRQSGFRGQHRGFQDSGTNQHQHTSSNWNGDNADSSHQSARTEYSGARHSSGSGHSSGGVNGKKDDTSGGAQHYGSSSWSDDNVDLSFAAVGPQDQLSTSGIQIGGSEKSRSSHHSSSSWSSGSEKTKDQHFTSSSSTDDDSGSLKLYQRYRREASEETLQDLLHCNATICTMMSCVMGPLTKGSEVQVVFRSRVWVQTLKKISANRIVKVSSRMALQVTNLPYIGAPHKPILRSHEVFTDVISTDSPVKPDIVPLWVVVLSAVAGAIILLLLIFLLWKCGFFKRNRPSDSAEKEPLNRNGHYSAGDEAL